MFTRTLLALLLFLTACSDEERLYKTRGHVFGTTVDITIYGGSQQRADLLGAEVGADRPLRQLLRLLEILVCRLLGSVIADKDLAQPFLVCF